MLALFGRAALRDFLDVEHLSERFDREDMLHLAAEIDAGFDRRVLAEMLDTIDRPVGGALTRWSVSTYLGPTTR